MDPRVQVGKWREGAPVRPDQCISNSVCNNVSYYKLQFKPVDSYHLFALKNSKNKRMEITIKFKLFTQHAKDINKNKPISKNNPV